MSARAARRGPRCATAASSRRSAPTVPGLASPRHVRRTPACSTQRRRAATARTIAGVSSPSSERSACGATAARRALGSPAARPGPRRARAGLRHLGASDGVAASRHSSIEQRLEESQPRSSSVLARLRFHHRPCRGANSSNERMRDGAACERRAAPRGRSHRDGAQPDHRGRCPPRASPTRSCGCALPRGLRAGVPRGGGLGVERHIAAVPTANRAARCACASCRGATSSRSAAQRTRTRRAEKVVRSTSLDLDAEGIRRSAARSGRRCAAGRASGLASGAVPVALRSRGVVRAQPRARVAGRDGQARGCATSSARRSRSAGSGGSRSPRRRVHRRPRRGRRRPARSVGRCAARRAPPWRARSTARDYARSAARPRRRARHLDGVGPVRAGVGSAAEERAGVRDDADESRRFVEPGSIARPALAARRRLAGDLRRASPRSATSAGGASPCPARRCR